MTKRFHKRLLPGNVKARLSHIMLLVHSSQLLQDSSITISALSYK